MLSFVLFLVHLNPSCDLAYMLEDTLQYSFVIILIIYDISAVACTYLC